MNPTRRDFFRLGLGSSTLLACGTSVPGFLARSALAAPREDKLTGRVLVVLELNGGNDGLNTVVPYGDDLYRKHRPKLQIAAGSLRKVNDHIGLHPALRGLSDLLKHQKLAIVQSVGYPNANRSHFESMAIWQTATLQPDVHTAGWLNRGVSRRSSAGDGDGTAMHIGDTELPRALAGDALSVPSLTRLDQIVRRLGVPDRAGVSAQRRRPRPDRWPATRRPGLAPAIRPAKPGRHLRQQRPHRGSPPRREGRGELRVSQLRPVSAIETGRPAHQGGAIDLDLLRPARRIRHPSEPARGARLTPGGIEPIHRGVLRRPRAAGEESRVMLLTFSEFGRRLTENASRGTDHGTAAPVFLVGPGVRPGLHGPYPNLTDLEDGDPRQAIDFRRIYATLLDRWLNCSSRLVLGQEFPHLSEAIR